MVDRLGVASCGIEYEHTFAVVDFGKNPNYHIILGRPFMRQMKMIQDWGYDHIYLRQPTATTKVNLKDHSYKDVRRTPVEDFASSTMIETTTPTWLVKEDLCHLEADDEGERGWSEEDNYVPEPFPEDELEPHGWHDILATLDVCANKVYATQHCDEEGYDITSLNMISVQREGPILEELSPEEYETLKNLMAEQRTNSKSESSSTSCEEEIIMEGPNAHTSRIQTIVIPQSQARKQLQNQ